MDPRAVGLYRRLLRLFPAAFRHRFGDDMADLFADRLREAETRGRLATAGFWAWTLADVSAQAWLERRADPHRPLSRRLRMRHVWDDVLAAVRAHVRRPGFASAAVVMLALGLGFNTALFAVVKSVLLTPLPFPNPDRLVMLWTGRNPDGTGGVNSYADLVTWRERSQSFDALATYNISFMTLVRDGDAEEIHGSVVSPEFFRVLGARFAYGRGIEAGDENITFEQGRPIVLSYALWTRRFNADPALLNHTIMLGARLRRVVGITSPGFVHPEPFWDADAQYWVPMPVTDQMRTAHGNRYLRVIGRLKAGVPIARARAEMDGIGHQLMTEHPDSNRASVVVDRLQDDLVGDTKSLALLFLGASSLVLCLGIANIVNLLLAQVSRRRAEFAIRSALGASHLRVTSQIVIESTLVAIVGGLVGLGLARLMIQAIVAEAPSNILGLTRTAIDGGVIAFTIALSTATGLLCGMLPAWRVARARLGTSLGGTRMSAGLEVSRTRTWLVAAELALALPLLVGTGLLAESLVHLQRVDLGFDPSHAIQFRVTVDGDRYATSEADIAFFDELARRLRAIPGVTSAGAVSSLPLGGLNNTGGSIVYRQPDGSEATLSVGMRSTTAGYFPSLGIPVRRGRLFSMAADDTNTIVVNDAAAARMFGDLDPLGRQIRFGQAGVADKKSPWLTVIGVVGSDRHERVSTPPNPEVFQPYQSNTWGTMTVVAGTDGDPATLAPAVRRTMHDLDPRLAVVNLAPVSTFFEGQLERPKFGAEAAALLAGVGLVLAAFGIFAVLSLLVTQRTREIGIRMALGSTRARIGALLVRESMWPVAAGCLVGGLGAAALARALGSELFGVTATDPMTFAAAIATLVVTAILAVWRPARRAMGVNPIAALRAE